MIHKRIEKMHMGIIIDGNRRWAKKRGLPAFEGHRQGLEKLKKVIKWCKEKRIKILTLYAFSTENWQRHKTEVNFLMRLLNSALTRNIKELNEQGVKLLVIGQKERLSPQLQKSIEKAQELTKNNKEMILNLAISYGGRVEIVEAIKKIIKENVPVDKIDEEMVGDYLWTAGLPDPDLIIRTSGEQRLSNFLTWQAAYSELYFSEKYWPDFTEEDLDKALNHFANRQRRFGK